MSSESLLESETIRLERRERRISGGEETLAQRLRELDEREDAIERREVSVETDFEIGHEKLERRERELAEREQRVTQRESSLEAYVASTQSEFQRRERALKSA